MRYLPHSAADRQHMLATIGASSIDDLFAAVPKSVLGTFSPDLPDHQPEFAVEAHMRGWQGPTTLQETARSLWARAPIAIMFGHRRSSDPALGMAYGLYALPAGNLAGHAPDAL